MRLSLSKTKVIAQPGRIKTISAALSGLFVAALLATGCTSPGPATGQTMIEAVTTKPNPQAPGGKAPPGPPLPPTVDNRLAGSSAIATVNDRPIPYSVWLNLLKRSHGLPALQYILGVELARQAAEAKGIRLTEDQMEQLYRKEMADLAGPEVTDPAQQERVLKAILERRGITMDEFRLLTRRNAYLRRIVEPIVERSITQDAIQVEFDRLYGEKVQIRHIQLADNTAVSNVMKALDEGMDFVEAVHKFSQNVDTAANDGLLPPFSKADPAVPAGLREVAFAAQVGKVAGPVRIDAWSQIIKVEARLPAQPVELAKVQDQVRQSLKDQMVLQQMQQTLQSMLQSAVIQIHDAELNKQFQTLRAATDIK